MWFTDVASADNPGKEELRLFVQDVRHFLFFILEDRQNFGFLWQHDPSLYDLAMDTMQQDIAQGAGLESTVHCSGGTALALHLRDIWDDAPYVGFP